MAQGLNKRGQFITFEGAEGSGKSTQARLLCRYLKALGWDALFIREPGGVKISEAIRRILLDVKNENMSSECETLLYMAARAQLVAEVIEPALKKGTIVVCDRFLDSTVAYQGYGNGADVSWIKELGEAVCRRIKPDMTFLMDLSTAEGFSRKGKSLDRIERRAVSYHNRVRRGYLEIARRDPGRVKVIAADRSRKEIQEMIRRHIEKILE